MMDKQELYEIIEHKQAEVLDLSDKIWGYAELSMLEYKSTAAYVELMKKEGFQVTENLCGIPTAFSGSSVFWANMMPGPACPRKAARPKRSPWWKTAAARAADTICWAPPA